MTSYSYTKIVNSDDLTAKIEASAIVSALDHIDTSGNSLTIWFKEDLSSGDHTILDNLIANYSYTPPTPAPSSVEVTTQYEKNDKDLKIACMSATVDASTGLASCSLVVPGVMVNGDGRYVAGGSAFFSVADAGDKVLNVDIIDVDNVLGAGANTVVKSYTDLEQTSDQQGWFIPPKRGQLDVEPIGGYGFIPAQLYIRISGQKVSTNKTGNFYINLFWGKKE